MVVWELANSERRDERAPVSPFLKKEIHRRGAEIAEEEKPQINTDAHGWEREARRNVYTECKAATGGRAEELARRHIADRKRLRGQNVPVPPSPQALSHY